MSGFDMLSGQQHGHVDGPCQIEIVTDTNIDSYDWIKIRQDLVDK